MLSLVLEGELLSFPFPLSFPTDKTWPFSGFSCAESGIIIPEDVVDSWSRFFTITRSFTGASFIGDLCDISAGDNEVEGLNGRASPMVTNVRSKKAELGGSILINLM